MGRRKNLKSKPKTLRGPTSSYARFAGRNSSRQKKHTVGFERDVTNIDKCVRGLVSKGESILSKAEETNENEEETKEEENENA